MAFSDALLISQAQQGNSDAFAELWQRHETAARWATMTITPDADVDDIVQEVFLQLFSALQSSPSQLLDGPFRQHVYVAVRNVVESTASPATVPLAFQLQVDYFGEFTDAFAEHTLVSSAYTSLSEEWRTILWYTEVEQLTPAEIAPLLGSSPNAVAALAYRAREGLRTAWLQAHIQSLPPSKDCGWTAQNLGSYVRGSLSAKKTTRITEHLSACQDCTLLVHEVNLAAQQLRGLALFIALGVSVGGTDIVATLAGSAAALGKATGLGSGLTGSVGSGSSTLGTAATSLSASGSGAVGSGVSVSASAFAATSVPAAVTAASSASATLTMGGAITALSAVAASLALGATFVLTDSSSALPGTAATSSSSAAHTNSSPPAPRGFFGQSAQFVANSKDASILPNSADSQLGNNYGLPAGPAGNDSVPSQNLGNQQLDPADSSANSGPLTPSQRAGTNSDETGPSQTVQDSSKEQKGTGATGDPQYSSSVSGSSDSPASGTGSGGGKSPSTTTEPAGSGASTSTQGSSSSSTTEPDAGSTTGSTSKPGTGLATESPSSSDTEGTSTAFTAAQVNKTSSGAPYFSGTGPQVGLIDVVDEYGVVVGTVVIGHDYRWGLRVIDTYTQHNKTSMTYEFHVTDTTGKRRVAATVAVRDLTA